MYIVHTLQNETCKQAFTYFSRSKMYEQLGVVLSMHHLNRKYISDFIVLLKNNILKLHRYTV